MEFNSWSFVMFFPVVCLLYWCIKGQRFRNVFLLAASYYFYMCWNASYGLLLLTSTLISYGVGLRMESTESRTQRKWLVGAGVVLNLALIAYFKYANFGVETVNWVMQLLGVDMNVPLPNILLPVGVSFFVFQSVGYTVDVYRRTVPAERNFVNYALFISFFPQLVAGPIERSGNMLPQFREQRTFDDDKAISGLKLMLWGYFMKLVLADRCGLYVGSVFDAQMEDGYSSLIAILLFSFEIYGDFAGYTYIAIGAARIMGFHLNDNFRHPYFSATVTEFWRRWHISLSTWFRAYLYFPLGGRRCGKWRVYFNLMVTFLASGLWHGAGWSFVLWGGLHGLLLCIERAFHLHDKKLTKFRRVPHVVITFLMVSLCWMIFRVQSLERIAYHLQRACCFDDISLGDTQTCYSLAVVFFAILVIAVKESFENYAQSAMKRLSSICVWWIDVMIALFLLLSISFFASPKGGAFIYFQF
ncbi:MAG: MBOAT family protein [Muribaculaceae bacterium]|nr:MBOAT family protein [Muribaculaceae bacterium]